ncbi:MAG TPA: hypothetical protein VEB20_02365 [Azospirillaceae bacterium]|nr:hypothetical protein [Azospirillaceae bacterium]
MPDLPMLDHYRRLTKDTTIDSNTLLSTDYFNHFNEVIMLLSMLGDMPDMLEEIAAWQPKTYREHFEGSGLAFAPLAIECYDHVPPEFREPFDATVAEMTAMIQESVGMLEAVKDDPDALGFTAADYWQRLQALVDRGSAIVHGSMPAATLTQSAIDDLF